MKGKMKISTMVMSRFIGFTALSLILCLLVVGCSIQKRVYVQESVIIDYSKYNNKGFFITESNSVNFEYKAIGSISAKVESGYGTVDSYKEKTMNDDLYPQEMSVKVKYRDYIQATPEAALETLYATFLGVLIASYLAFLFCSLASFFCLVASFLAPLIFFLFS